MISSTNVAGVAILVISMMGVVGIARVTEASFSTTRTVLAPRLEMGLIFRGPYLCVHPLVELHRHPYKRRTLVKKKKKK